MLGHESLPGKQFIESTNAADNTRCCVSDGSRTRLHEHNAVAAEQGYALQKR